MKNAVFWDVTCAALVRTDVSEKRIASIIRVTSIGELEMLAVISNRSTLRRITVYTYVPLKRRFLQEPHGVTSQTTAFFKDKLLADPKSGCSNLKLRVRPTYRNAFTANRCY
jgi:hypothetical protein